MQVRCYWIPGTADLPADPTAVPGTYMRILDTGEADKVVYSLKKADKGCLSGMLSIDRKKQS